MAWLGYFTIGDGDAEVEIINVARTEAYAAGVGLRWFTPIYNSIHLAAALGEGPYVNPADDPAPWYDANEPASAEFFGLYPMDVMGIDDSTRESDVIQSTLNGGLPGRLRYATKTPVFNGTLLASSARGAEYGMRWLSRATAMVPCLPAQPNFLGHTLHYLSSDPSKDPGCAVWAEDPPEPSADPPILTTFERTLRRFKINVGPRPIAKHDTSDGGAMWNVQMTGSAGVAWQFGAPRQILDDMTLDGGDPYFAGIEGGVYDVTGEVIEDAICPEPLWSPIYSPNCPPLASPPAVPTITNICVDVPDTWFRIRASIPAAYIPVWGDAVPIVYLTAGDDPVETMRMRFWADVNDDGIPVDCADIADYVITYIPAGWTMQFDGITETVYVIDPDTGDRQSADNLVSKTDGSPFDWPHLTCGLGYIVTLDFVDDAASIPVVDLSLVPRTD